MSNEIEESEAGGISRRSAIKYGSIGAGLLVATPTILTLGATPASASGDGATKYAQASDTTGRTVSLAIDGPGLWVVATFVRGNTSTSATAPITLSLPSGWTGLIAQKGTNTSSGLNSRITMRAFYRWFDPSVWDPDVDPFALNVGYASTGGGATTGLVRGATGYNFPNATTATNPTSSAVGSGTSASTTATGIGTRFLFMCGAINSSTLSPAAPTGYSGTSTNLDTTANSVSGSIALGSFLSTTKYNTDDTSGAVTASWGSTPTTQVSMLVSIV